MDAQILFLGLMMFCVDGTSGAYNVDCPLLGADTDPPGRVYLVDATDRGKWCGATDCRACPSVSSDYRVSLHVPYLVVSKANVKPEGSIEVPDCRPKKGLGCWNLTGKKLTFELVPGGDLKVNLGRETNEPTPKQANRESFYGWLASMSYFGNCGQGAECFANLDPAQCADDGSVCRVAAWVDLAKNGKLYSALIGRNGKDVNRYSEWERDDNKASTPLYTALADGALWSVPMTDPLKVCDQKGECVIVEGSGSKGPRLAIVNLPEGFLDSNKKSYPGATVAEETPETSEESHAQAARGPETVSKKPETLDHFRMYYQLYKDEYADHKSECSAPRIKAGSSSWKPFARLRDWLAGKSTVHIAPTQPPVKMFLIDDALCPPSKFP